MEIIGSLTTLSVWDRSAERYAPPLAVMTLIFALSATPDLSSGLGAWDSCCASSRTSRSSACYGSRSRARRVGDGRSSAPRSRCSTRSATSCTSPSSRAATAPLSTSRSTRRDRAAVLAVDRRHAPAQRAHQRPRRVGRLSVSLNGTPSISSRSRSISALSSAPNSSATCVSHSHATSRMAAVNVP